MEFLSAIGTAIVGKIAEYTVGPVVRQISYVTGCKGNLQQLNDAVVNLKAARDSVANEVGEADRRGERIQPDVQLWLKKVDEITAKKDQFLQDERPAELKCFHGGFFGNLKIRHRISRKATKLLQEVVELDEKRGFSTVSCGIRRQEVCGVSTGDYQAFASRTSTVKKIMDELKKPNSKRIGVYGIGGVGKTTLVQQVYKQATEVEKNLFDDVVILLDVKENPDLGGIQKKIVEKLGMKILDNETMDGRASRVCARIKDKKTLVILDDVWEEIKLEAVGIPSVATCKILLTCRSKKPLSDMNTDKDFELDILKDEENWVLFESKAGDVVKDPAIRKVATQIAKCCKGLPVLVVTIASTLKKRTSLPLWEDALTCLEGSNSQQLTEKAYSGLEWSYSKLNNEELQQFFLLCGIVIQWNTIFLRDLLRYGMGLGLLGKVSTLKEARNKVLSRVEQLKDFCLLIHDENSEYVRMHDLVRDVAKRIALRKHILSSVVDGGGHEWKEWPDKDFLEKCPIIYLPSGNNISRLPQVLQCQALRMFLFHGKRAYDSLTILPTFFQETKQLNVLVLENMRISSLPSSFQSLKNVQTLCLEGCDLGDITMVGELSNLEILSFAYSDFEQLPKEVAQLTHLRLLDLTRCSKLQVISPGVLSRLTSLEDLRMKSFDKWEAEGEGSNASLSELKHLSQLTALQIDIPDANILSANLFSYKLETYEIVIGRADWSFYSGFDGNLNTLKIAESIQLDEGLEMLLKKSHQLHLAGTFGTKNTLDHRSGAEEFKQLKLLHLKKNFDFTYFINRKVCFSWFPFGLLNYILYVIDTCSFII